MADKTETTLRAWGVTVPIAGHAYIIVDAATEAEAIELALCNVTSEHLEGWDALERFHRGNVCYCPSPWEASAVDETPDED